jgi:hypothetical protein
MDIDNESWMEKGLRSILQGARPFFGQGRAHR